MRAFVPPPRDLALAAALAIAAQLETWLGTAEPKPVQAAAALALTIPLAWRRRAPIAVLLLVVSPLLAMALANTQVNSAYVMAVLIVAFYSVGAGCERQRALAGAAAGLGLLALLIAIEPETPLADFVFIAVIVTVVFALAVALRERGLRAGELERRAAALEREREQAVADERARIARELHDIVAHSVSMVVVQTGAVRRRLRHDRPREAEELEGVERAARQALAEMRRLLGILRTDPAGLALAPQPGVDDLERLVAQVREAGLPVELDVRGERVPLAPGVDLAVYRIVQEALTNALKHAGRARAAVVVRYGERELELEVADDGAGAAANGSGAGHGLIGMRERVVLYGGELETGPRPGGGFLVRARLPLEAG